VRVFDAETGRIRRLPGENFLIVAHFPIESGRNEAISTQGQIDTQLDEGIGNTLVSIDQNHAT
jgi:hypothetical protein